MSEARWTAVPERGSFGAMRVGIFFLNLLGYHFGQVIGFFVTVYFFITGRVSRRASRSYLTHLRETQRDAPKPSLWHCFKHHWSFTISVIDRLWFWQGRLDGFTITSEGRENIEKANGGIILVGAHLGSFDAMRALSTQKKMKLNVVMHRGNAQHINRLLKELNPESDVQVVELDASSVDQVFALQQKLEAGEAVAILADRPAPHGRPRITELPFLGKDAPFPQNPWILASLLKAPVATAVGLRLGWRRYHVCVRMLAERIDLPRNIRMQALREYMEVYRDRLEEVCRENPFQWFNFYDFWGEHDA